MFIYAVFFGAFSVLLPNIGQAFGVGPGVAGRLFPADFTGFILGVLVCGYLSDILGRKIVLSIGLVVCSVGLAIFGYSGGMPLALLASGLIGAGTGAMETVASALATDLYPECKARLIMITQVAFGLGASIGPFVAQGLLMSHVSWRMIYLSIAIGTFVIFLLLAIQPAPQAIGNGVSIDLSALKKLLSQPYFIGLCLAQALYVGAEVGYFSWLPTYFGHTIQNSAIWAGLSVTVFWIAITVGRITTGALLERIGLLRLTFLLSIFSSIGILITVLAPGPLITMVGVMWTGLCCSGIYGLVLSMAGERYSDITGTAFAGIMACGGVGGAIIPWIAGVIGASVLGWHAALGLMALIMVLLAALMLNIRRM